VDTTLHSRSIHQMPHPPVREHRIGLDALYGNLLTGLARAEELLRQTEFVTDLGRRCGVKVDSMMISAAG
jgi:hypothetical protein